MYYANLCSSVQLYYTGNSSRNCLWQSAIKTLTKGSKYRFCGTFVTNMKMYNYQVYKFSQSDKCGK